MSRKYGTTSFRLCRCCYKWRCQCLVPRKKKSHPPFNSGTKQSNKLGLHPKLNAPISPPVGSYDPRPIDRKSVIISWKKQQETEEFSAAMGGRLTRKIVDRKSLMKVGCGPGSHEILRWPESTMMLCYTLRTHNPFFYLDQKRLKGFSPIPSFEFDNLVPRFRETIKCWSLPCTRYSVKHPNSLQAFLEKITGKRGPYDLFTGPRDETTIRHLIRAKLEDHGDWPRKLPDEIEKLSNKCNYFKGKWSINPRFTKKPTTRMMLQNISTCYKDPDEPGPAHYNPRMLQRPSSTKRYPFDSNIQYIRPLPPRGIPGPGRYKIKQSYRVKGHGWKSVFKSKVPRIINVAAPSYNY